MPYVELPGVHLWYTDTGGTGTPVIFLHAASGTCESWVYQVPAFTEAGYRCVTYDRRGWGRSRANPTGEQPGYGSDDLHGLADHIGLDYFHLVATAAGGIGGLRECHGIHGAEKGRSRFGTLPTTYEEPRNRRT